MPTHRLDRWMRAHHLQLRIVLLVLAVVWGVALYLDAILVLAIVSLPIGIVGTLVMIYLPRSTRL